MHRIFLPLALLAMPLGAPAYGQEVPSEEMPPTDEQAPQSAWEALQRLPPRFTWEIGLHVSYVRLAYFRDDTGPWVGFGLRGGWGRVLSTGHRLGVGLVFNADGPIPIYWTASLEPQFNWDWIVKHVQLGASVGPSLMLHNRLELTTTETTFGVAPMVAGRLGYSESWSRVGRRFFVVVEPKVRWVDATVDWAVALVVGSGSGR